MQAVGPLPPRHEAAGELVDDHHLAVLHDVVDVALVEMVGLERIVDEVGPLHVARGVEALHAGELLGRPHALLGEGHGVFLLLHLEVAVGHQLPGDLIGLGVFRDVVVGGAGDDQRRASLVDEDVVHLVDDREGERPLALLHVLGEAVVAAGGHPHVVAEVVEAEFVVGAVGDVAGIRLLPLARVHTRLDRTHREAEPDVERPHPFHVAAGEVVVDGDDMHARAFERVEIGRQRGDERLSLTGNHLCDGPRMEHHAADQLHVIVPHAEKPTAPLAADGKGLDQDVVEGFAAGQTPPEIHGLAAEFGIGHGLVFRLQGVDRLDPGLQTSQIPGIGRSKQPGDEPFEPGTGTGGHVRETIPEAFELLHNRESVLSGDCRGLRPHGSRRPAGQPALGAREKVVILLAGTPAKWRVLRTPELVPCR